MRTLLAMTMMLLCGLTAQAQAKGHAMQANGTFEVKVAPAEGSDFEKANELNRYTLDKVWHGSFEGTSKGEMLGANASTGAMAYVAVERMTGRLDGKEGAFLLLHNAHMTKADPKSAFMQVTIVPSSGTGELAGITGTLTIVVEPGKHSWTLDYILP